MKECTRARTYLAQCKHVKNMRELNNTTILVINWCSSVHRKILILHLCFTRKKIYNYIVFLPSKCCGRRDSYPKTSNLIPLVYTTQKVHPSHNTISYQSLAHAFTIFLSRPLSLFSAYSSRLIVNVLFHGWLHFDPSSLSSAHHSSPLRFSSWDLCTLLFYHIF